MIYKMEFQPHIKTEFIDIGLQLNQSEHKFVVGLQSESKYN